MSYIQILYSVTSFCNKIRFYILVVGLSVASKAVGAADECNFGQTGKKYCHYGCCDKGCCPMTRAAIVGLIIAMVLGVASLVGCIVCLYCIFKQQTTPAMVRPWSNKAKQQYVHESPNDSTTYGKSSSSPGDPVPFYTPYTSAYDKSEPHSGK